MVKIMRETCNHVPFCDPTSSHAMLCKFSKEWLRHTNNHDTGHACESQHVSGTRTIPMS